MKYYHFIAEKNKNKKTNKQKQTKCKQYPTDSEQNKLCSYDTFSNSQNMKQRRPRGNVQQKTELFHFQFTKYRVKIYCCVNHEFLREVMFICQLIECNCDVMAK